MSFGESFTIVGDGKSMAIICGDIAYVMGRVDLETCELSHDRPMIDITEFGGAWGQSYLGYRSTRINLTLRVDGELKIVPANKVKLNNVENMSILELLAYINKKLNEREENNGKENP